jgi:hypothetical protein
VSLSLTSEVLRGIGENLELRGIKTFIIRCEEDSFAVDGGYQSPPAPMPVSLYYSANDIRELERKARERNDYLSATRSFIYLPEILSSISGDQISRKLILSPRSHHNDRDRLDSFLDG